MYKIFYNPIPVGSFVNVLKVQEDGLEFVYKGQSYPIVGQLLLNNFYAFTEADTKPEAKPFEFVVRGPSGDVTYLIKPIPNINVDLSIKPALAKFYEFKLQCKDSLELAVEFAIYYSKGVSLDYSNLFTSADKLRDDEVVCMGERVSKPDGLAWFISLCKLFEREKDLSRMQTISWLWKKRDDGEGIRLYHFISGPQAEKILANKCVPVGTFILRPSFTNAGSIAATFKVKGRIKHGIFEDPSIIRQKLKDDTELAYGLIAAPVPEFGNLNNAPKAEFFKEIDQAMFPNTIKSPAEGFSYIRVNVGQCVNQPFSDKCLEPRKKTEEEIEKDKELSRLFAHAGYCRVFGILERFRTHQDNKFTIQAVNCLCEDLKKGGCIFEVGIIGVRGGRANVKDNDNGTYTVTFYSPIRGDHRISIRLMGQEGIKPPYPECFPGWEKHIKDSPFRVYIDRHPDASVLDDISQMEWEQDNITEMDKEGFAAHIRQQKSIYGTDCRIEACDVGDEYVKRNIQCVLSIWVKEDIEPRGAGFSQLKIRKFGRDYQLHPDEPFFDQPIGATGTAFLVTPRIIVTAGHCISEREGYVLERLRFVVGYMENESEMTETFISNDRIYYAVKLLYHKEEEGMHDVAIIELDRDVKNAYKPTAVAELSKRTEDKDKKITSGTEVYVIGHPCGLPMKVARHTKSLVTIVSDTTFQAKLDAFGGNSGSPVFNGNTHQVEGILIGGQPDFVRVEGKFRSVTIPKGSRCGETCYDITHVRQILETLYIFKSS